MLHWYPRLTDLAVPTPDTVFVPLDHLDATGDCPVEWDTDAVRDAVETVGGPPAFVRTDVASYKHRMADASKLPAVDDATIDDHLFEVVSFNEMATLYGLPYQVIAVREWLDLDSVFTAFHGTPIARELRFFVDDDGPVCCHFYWPEDAIEFYGDTEPPADWRQRLARFRAATNTDPARRIVEQVADAFDGAWSIDVARTVDGTWYVIDMARAADSWHPDCPYADLGQSERSDDRSS